MTEEKALSEKSLTELWTKARLHLIVSQFAPTFLLIVTIGLLDAGLTTAPASVRLAAAGILLASGILGALAQISVAGEAAAIIDDLDSIVAPSAVAQRIIASRRWLLVPKFVTPAIFVLVYIALLVALFLTTR
ncbi:hypothetical protein [Frigoribacterium sp. UYMn621]|jgi:hypothetical protein|uniref:hypothetical protein n=1 Tax=Frigoribacterium sp. UYMn621 TaxID=3156343 RepID=UPI003391E79E